MATQSVVRAASCCAKLSPALIRNVAVIIRSRTQPLVGQQVRGMGHGRSIEILPSRYEYNKYKDQAHFYFWLGAIPLTLITAWANLFVGEAELAEVPEDYEPKHWEYFKHPVSRFLSRVCHDSFQRQYEMNLHYISAEHERMKYRKIEAKVKELIKERGDYKAWYYVPYNADHIYKARKEADEINASNAVV